MAMMGSWSIENEVVPLIMVFSDERLLPWLCCPGRDTTKIYLRISLVTSIRTVVVVANS